MKNFWWRTRRAIIWGYKLRCWWRESFDSSEEDSKELTENLEELNESPDSNNDSSDDEDASASNDEADFKENFRDEIEATKKKKRRQA